LYVEPSFSACGFVLVGLKNKNINNNNRMFIVLATVLFVNKLKIDSLNVVDH